MTLKIFSSINQSRFSWLMLLVLLAFTLAGVSCSVGVGSTITDGGVYRSSDQAKTWKQIVYVGQSGKKVVTIANLNVRSLAVSPIDTATVYAVAGDNGLYQTTNAGEVWQQVFRGTGVQALALHPRLRDVMYLAAGNRIYRTTNGAKDWQGVYFETTADVAVTDLAIDILNPKVLYAGTSKGSLIKSDDEGASWQPVYFFKQRVAKVEVNPRDSKVLYVAQPNGSLWRSADAGGTWTEVSLGIRDQLKKTYGSYKALAFLAGRPDAVIYATQYGLFRSLASGTVWEEVKLVTPPNAVGITALVTSPTKEQDIFYATLSTFYRSSDSGASWETLPLPSKRQPTALVLNPSDLQVMYLGFSK